MSTWFTILTILILIASILLILVVLAQSGKGDGMASNFVAGNQVLGVRQMADSLEKISWGLVTFILVMSIVTSIAISGSRQSGVDVTDQIETVEQPAFPGIQTEAPATEVPADSASN